jgi:hypothetical protein
MEMMLARLAVIWGGVCERHPKLRVAFLESGGGWIAPWLDRMDRHFDDQFFNDSDLKTRPSGLFQRNCWISFEPVETSSLSGLSKTFPANHHVDNGGDIRGGRTGLRALFARRRAATLRWHDGCQLFGPTARVRICEQRRHGRE